MFVKRFGNSEEHMPREPIDIFECLIQLIAIQRVLKYCFPFDIFSHTVELFHTDSSI